MAHPMLWSDGCGNQVTPAAWQWRPGPRSTSLLGEYAGRDVPVGQAPIDAPAQRDAVERDTSSINCRAVRACGCWKFITGA